MKKALVVVDAQEYFRNRRTEKVFKRLNVFLRKNAKRYDDVIFLRYVNKPGSGLWNAGWKEMTKNEKITQLADEVKAFSNSKNTFDRASFSGFTNPIVGKRLKKNKIEQIDLAGFETHCCIFSTAMDAFDKGYTVHILPRVSGSHFGEKFHQQALVLWKLNTG